MLLRKCYLIHITSTEGEEEWYEIHCQAIRIIADYVSTKNILFPSKAENSSKIPLYGLVKYSSNEKEKKKHSIGIYS